MLSIQHPAPEIMIRYRNGNSKYRCFGICQVPVYKYSV